MLNNAIITPRLVVRDAHEAIAFYTRVFGAREQARFTTPDGRVIHAELSALGAPCPPR